MTDEDIQALARQFSAYADTVPTLRGADVIAFARAVLAAGHQEWRNECLDQLRASKPLED